MDMSGAKLKDVLLRAIDSDLWGGTSVSEQATREGESNLVSNKNLIFSEWATLESG